MNQQQLLSFEFAWQILKLNDNESIIGVLSKEYKNKNHWVLQTQEYVSTASCLWFMLISINSNTKNCTYIQPLYEKDHSTSDPSVFSELANCGEYDRRNPVKL